MITLDRVTYAYPGATTPALADITLTIEPGELVIVAGGSGSGKSTLLRVISGLVPHFHGGTFGGTATVAGLDTRAHGPGELAAVVGTLFQDPESQIVMGTVRAELAFGLENQGHSPERVARAVEEAALALGIAHLLDRSTAELSGGELQRTALGAALAGRPEVLVLDEPTSQLDPVAGDELIGLLRRANDDADTTIVLAEHRLERCLHAADRVIALDGGRVVCDGSPEAFLEWAGRRPPACRPRGPSCSGRWGWRRSRGSSAPGRRCAPETCSPSAPRGARPRPRHPAPRRGGPPAALEFTGVWHELRSGPALLRGVSLAVAPGERIALMGRNGAGKSTLLRHAAGLMAPTRGRVRSAGRVGLLAQNPLDYLVHERVEEEASTAALAAVGLGDPALGARHPRDLSGGEKQRLALAVVIGDAGQRPDVLCLDEPTRGMDRDHRGQLVGAAAEPGRRGDRRHPRSRVRRRLRPAGGAARRRGADRRRAGRRRSSPAAATS